MNLLESIPDRAWYALAGLVVGLLAGRFAGTARRVVSSGGGGRRSSSAPSSRAAAGSGTIELYVGNLAYDVTDEELMAAFQPCGAVASARLIENRLSGRPKGFGFVQMASRADADKAIKTMNGAKIKGRAIVVSEAKSRPRSK